MPVPPEQRIKFFVFVIESPSAVDLYHRRSEGDIIRQAVELNGITCIVKMAISREAFEACLKVGLSEAMAQMPGYMPLLHISAHGDSDGIQLSDGYNMLWSELKELIRPVNAALSGSLVVCMSSCEGYSGVRMAMHHDDDLAYYALVGCGTKPIWSETAVGYATLYHHLWRGEYISDAVAAMRVVSGNTKFFVEHAEISRKSYLDFLNTLNPANAQEKLEQAAAEEPHDNSSLIKALSGSP